MSVEKELAYLLPTKDMMLTVGVFDGVHLGHKQLLHKLVIEAKLENLISGVVTFRHHPQSLFKPQSKLKILTSLPQRIKLLKDEGIEVIITLNFTLELAQIGIQQLIGLFQKHLKMHGLVVGPDFAMGRNREGNVDMLHTLKKSMGFSLSVIPSVLINNETVSSTAIRNALAQGDMAKVNSMLSRYFSIEGRVIVGSGRGKDLGFPTSNIDVDPAQALPSDGVYASLVCINGKSHQSVTNIGSRPTFGEAERTIEVHIFDYNEEIYRRNIKVDIIERIRNEQMFATSDELVKQIKADIVKTRGILNHLNSD